MAFGRLGLVALVALLAALLVVGGLGRAVVGGMRGMGGGGASGRRKAVEMYDKRWKQPIMDYASARRDLRALSGRLPPASSAPSGRLGALRRGARWTVAQQPTPLAPSAGLWLRDSEAGPARVAKRQRRTKISAATRGVE